MCNCKKKNFGVANSDYFIKALYTGDGIYYEGSSTSKNYGNLIKGKTYFIRLSDYNLDREEYDLIRQ